MRQVGRMREASSSPRASLGRTSSAALWPNCASCRSQPDGGNQQPADPPSRPRNIPANSHQLGPRVALLAHRLSNYARHGHCGPPESCRCGYHTPPISPSVGTGSATFAFPRPSSLVSTPARIALVDSGSSFVEQWLNLCRSSSLMKSVGLLCVRETTFCQLVHWVVGCRFQRFYMVMFQ